MMIMTSEKAKVRAKLRLSIKQACTCNEFLYGRLF